MEHNGCYDLVGESFGKLKVVSLLESDGSGRRKWECYCECGGKATPTTARLISGKAQSCGCLRRTSGCKPTNTPAKAKEQMYNIYWNMVDRCHNSSNPAFPRYGGRGITVCEAWRKSFEVFYRDMGNKPPGMSIERIKNDGHYCLDNVKWGTINEQTRNRRSNINISINGESKCLTDWCKTLGLNFHTIKARIRRYSWSVAVAILAPSQAGKNYRVGEFAKQLKTLNSYKY